MWRQIIAHWRLKVALSIAFNLFFWAGYELLGHHAFFPLRSIPHTWFDQVIPFQPEPWAWVYLSNLFLATLLPWLLPTREEAIRCTAGLAVMSAISFVVFLFYPTLPPERPLAQHGSPAMAIIVGGDGSYTCFPSLHAASLCYMLALAWRLFKNTAPGFMWILCALWGVGVLYATIATRQHYALDLAAGAAVGCFSYWAAWRGAPAHRSPGVAMPH